MTTITIMDASAKKIDLEKRALEKQILEKLEKKENRRRDSKKI